MQKMQPAVEGPEAAAASLPTETPGQPIAFTNWSHHMQPNAMQLRNAIGE